MTESVSVLPDFRFDFAKIVAAGLMHPKGGALRAFFSNLPVKSGQMLSNAEKADMERSLYEAIIETCNQMPGPVLVNTPAHAYAAGVVAVGLSHPGKPGDVIRNFLQKAIPKIDLPLSDEAKSQVEMLLAEAVVGAYGVGCGDLPVPDAQSMFRGSDAPAHGSVSRQFMHRMMPPPRYEGRGAAPRIITHSGPEYEKESTEHPDAPQPPQA